MARHEFDPADIEDLLIRCHRRCCICHRFCGVKIEVDHIEGAETNSSGDVGNAIPLCFECHAEVHHYNPKHPKGRRFTASELRGHRDQWLRLCAERPDIFVHAQAAAEAGSLERLLSELEFNRALSAIEQLSGQFEVTQFRRAIADGTFSWVEDPLKSNVFAAYQAIVKANATLEAFAHRTRSESAAIADTAQAFNPICRAIEQLRQAL